MKVVALTMIFFVGFFVINPWSVYADTSLYKISNVRPNLGFKDMAGIFQDKVYFSGYDATYGNQLWVTDGTEAGTYKIKNIYPDPVSVSHTTGSSPMYFTPSTEALYFMSNDGVHGDELWKTDGTTNGTVLVKDIYVGTVGSEQVEHVVFNNKLYFHAEDSTNGMELWVSDGTEIGTQLLKDINPGSGSSYPYNFLIFNNELYFNADDGTHGYELWKTDGTPGGTVMIKDIALGSDDGTEDLPVIFNNELYFGASEDTNGWQLWKSDGTEIGTQIAAWLDPDGDKFYEDMGAVLGDKLFLIISYADYGNELAYTPDGTAGSLQMLKNINPIDGSLPSDSRFTVMNNKLYFNADDSVHEKGLWVTDGTEVGTVFVKDIFSGNVPVKGTFYTVQNNILYFKGYDSVHGYELWRSDGTTDGTYRISDINPGTGHGLSGLYTLVAFQDLLLFEAYDSTGYNGLWVYDTDMSNNPSQIFDAVPVNNPSNPNFPSNYAYPISFGPNYQGDGQAIVVTGDLENTNVKAVLTQDASVHDINVAIDKVLTVDLIEDKIKLPWQQGYNAAGEIYDFQSLSAFNGYPITQFDKPVIISIPYDPQKIVNIDPAKLKIGYYDTKTKQWKVMQNNNVVDYTNSTISNTTKQFTYFTVIYPR